MAVVRLLDSQNAILGRLPELAPSESANEIELATGDRLILYTDGLVEVFNSFEEMLGVEGLQEINPRICEATTAGNKTGHPRRSCCVESRPARRRRVPCYRRGSLATESAPRPRTDGSVALEDGRCRLTFSARLLFAADFEEEAHANRGPPMQQR